MSKKREKRVLYTLRIGQKFWIGDVPYKFMGTIRQTGAAKCFDLYGLVNKKMTPTIEVQVEV